VNDHIEPLPVAAAVAQRRRTPRARPYLRALWLIPGLLMLGIGLYVYYDVPDDGLVTTIQVTTKPGLVGQTAEALRLVQMGTPDLYLKIKTAAGEERTPTFHDTPLGNGLRWALKSPARMRHVKEVEIWDENVISDDFKDRTLMSGWSAEGQTFRVELIGEKDRPPAWALPVAAAGGAITLIALLRFVWDQVI
jgi:hypothetical protein